MEKALNEFIETFIEGSRITKVIYDNKTKKWVLIYEGDLPHDQFNSPKGMVDFLEADQQVIKKIVYLSGFNN